MGRGSSSEIEVAIDDVERTAVTLNDPQALRQSLTAIAGEWQGWDADERDRQLIHISQDPEAAALTATGAIPGLDQLLLDVARRRFALLKPSVISNLRAMAITCGRASRATPHIVLFRNQDILHLRLDANGEQTLCGLPLGEHEAITPFRRGSFHESLEGQRCSLCAQAAMGAYLIRPVGRMAAEPRDYNPCHTGQFEAAVVAERRMEQAARSTLEEGLLLDRLDLEYFAYVVEQAAVGALAELVIEELATVERAEQLANLLGETDPFDRLAAESGIDEIAATVRRCYPQSDLVVWPSQAEQVEMLQRVFLYRSDEQAYELQIGFLAELIAYSYPEAKAALQVELADSDVPGHRLLLRKWAAVES